MTIHSGAFDRAQGRPSLAALQYLEENWTADEINASLQVCKVSITTGGNAGVAAVIPVGAEIVDVVVHCTGSNGSGTARVYTNALTPVVISDAIACATVDTVARAATLDMTYKIVSADGIAVFMNGAADSGDIFIYYKK